MYSNSGQQNSGHLSLRSGNPALSSKTFSELSNASSSVMTIEGTVNKTAVSLLILMLCGYYTFTLCMCGKT